MALSLPSSRPLSLSPGPIVAIVAIVASGAFAGPSRATPSAPEPALPRGEIIDPVACETSPGQSYALYLPSNYDAGRKWPVLYAFDARQRGRLPIERYRAAAESLGWIVVSSNNSRSDEAMDPNVEAMKAMWEDSHKRFAIDPRRAYATGFSGGARAAVVLAVAQRGAVAGVIGHGGGFPFEWPPTLETSFAFYGLAGWTDFNYPELLRLDNRLAELGLDHGFEPFAGRHEWAPAEAAARSLAWMELLAMRRGLVAARADFVAEFWAESERAAEAAANDGDWVLARRRWEAMERDFAGLRDTAHAAARRQEIAATAAYQAERETQEKAEAEHARFVAAARERLANLLREPEPESVRAERAAAILDVPETKKIEAHDPSPYRRRAARRSLEALYVQTVFYVPREYQAKGDPARALLCLGIAVQVKPDEPWSWLSLAEGRVLAGDEKGSVAALRRAVEVGLSDPRAIEAEPAFAKLLGRRDLRELLQRMKAAPVPAPPAGPS